ncbi:MAG TPA: hypothetical protein VH682_06275 [Gemmataceae bacterium]|jgi:hypothetical protein
MILTHCPHCQSPVQASETLINQRAKCPQCEEIFTVTRPLQWGDSPCTAKIVTKTMPSFRRDSTPGWRFLSSPWVVLVFIFGFLPWSEVGCNNREIDFHVSQLDFHVSQSGYQALYGGVSAPPSIEIIEEKLRNSPIMSSQELRKKLGMERSFLSNASPFLVIFWGANLALLGVCCLSLGGGRLGFALLLGILMLSMLITHACLGLPLEYRTGRAIAEAVKEDPASVILLFTIKQGKTVWFWLTLTSVSLFVISELLLNILRAERRNDWQMPAGITTAATLLVIAGLMVQFSLRQLIVNDLENHLVQLQQAEKQRQEKEKQRREKAQAREEEKLAEVRRREALAAVKEKENQLLEERLRLEREQQEQQRRIREEQARQQEEEARRETLKRQEEAIREEQRRQEVARREAQRRQEETRREAQKKAAEESKRELMRKEELEKKGLPYYPLPRRQINNLNAGQWYALLQDRPHDATLHRQALTALVNLQEEGTPFLLEYLSKQDTKKYRDGALRLINPEYIHTNDLDKLIPCLEASNNYPGTRFQALKYLEIRAKDLNKKTVGEIQSSLADMLENPSLFPKTKDEISDRLLSIQKKVAEKQ